MRRLASFPLVALLLSALGCDAGSSPTDPTAPGELVQSNEQRDLTPVVPTADLAEAVAGNTAFAFDLYDRVRAVPGNLFFSPHSITLALAMTWAGARGETERQMADTLHFTLPADRLHAAMNALDLALASRGEGAEGQDGGAFRLNVTNAIWGQTGFPFLAPFLDVLAVNYGAGLRLLNFADDPEGSRLAINAWVEAMTEDRIQDLLPPGLITDLTRLVLTNAIYFNAAWATPFEPEATADAPFTRLDGSTVPVPTMHGLIEGGRHAELAGLQAIELPYDGHELSMVILLPDAGQLDAVEADLGARAAEALAALASQDLDLAMPRFGCEQAIGLVPTLAEMGMPIAFGDGADFTGMDGGLAALRITGVVHKAWVNVDEAGTEAAAATAVVVSDGAVGAPIPVTIDRPFLFFIRDIPTGAVLFVGRVVEP